MSKIESFNNWAISQPTRQVIMLFSALVIGLLLLIYLFLAIPLEEKKSQLEGEYAQSKRTLEALNLKQLDGQINSLEKTLLGTKAQVQELTLQAETSRENLEGLKALQHDNASWANVLEQLLQNSVKLGVDILSMEISSLETPYVGFLTLHKLLHVEGSGEFLAIEKWIRYAEDMPKTLKLKTLKIQEGEVPSFEAQFEVLGLIK